ncbi:MinD/ParA family protein [Anaerococcus sp. Marseille-P9784]|uniref:MinD/ParA family protein n=1 Tax=Anaerococcus sp. Marseille-P9784 TaxID=2614127 RepID=UPI00124AAF7D|nr:MinD/ParA family protein [Anaerococcus sp. Marseille-P9784]
MKTYIINGKEGIGKTDFSVNLAEYLQKTGKVLLLQTKRNPNSNIEDYFQKDGMITYDIGDYFSSLAPLEKVIVHENENLDFIISPLLEDKYIFRGEDVEKLLGEISYDYLVIDNLSKDLIKDKIIIEIIDTDSLNKEIEGDYFFINKASEDYDIRNDKNAIEAKNKRFLGLVKNGQYFNDVIENLLEDKKIEIPKISFFEKIKMAFKH